MKTSVDKSQFIAPWARVVILLIAIVAAGSISKIITGSMIPEKAGDVLIFQNALLLVVLGSSVVEHKFTKPGDAVVNSLMGIITLLGVYDRTNTTSWNVVFSYSLLVFLLATTCTIVSTKPDIVGWKEKIASFTYKPAVELGSARRLFSVVFFFAVLSFYDMRSTETATLAVFWGVFMILWPLGVPEFLSRIVSQGSKTVGAIGKITRTDYPNILRVALTAEADWSHDSLYHYCRSDGLQRTILPLYSQYQENQLLGTGLSIGEPTKDQLNRQPGYLYSANLSKEDCEKEIVKQLGGDESSTLIGFVIENSEIAKLKIETWDQSLCHEGKLVWSSIEGKKVYYQITSGITAEESLESDKHGFQIAEAAQLGVLEGDSGFLKYNWLPEMNTPIFSEPDDYGADLKCSQPNDFIYGNIPHSAITIGGDITSSFDHHIAILGVTGSGKTELAFDYIRDAARKGMKVICIDLTARYTERLSDLDPLDLSVSEEQARDLGEKLFDAETGEYGASKEKKVLASFAISLREEIVQTIESFINDSGGSSVGIVTLNEISNTKATLYITELYLTCLLNYAKSNQDTCPNTLIVVEEAHTVIPEPNTMGLGDFDSRGLVSKIAQIALQGRKYRVGLLVVAQRTATVSKTVLTQCNTIISFTCFDDTSIKFLQNIFGDSHIKLIPDLPPLHAIGYGKGIRSQRPIVFQVPFDESKVDQK